MLSTMYKNLSNPQTRYEENSFVTGFKAGIIAKNKQINILPLCIELGPV